MTTDSIRRFGRRLPFKHQDDDQHERGEPEVLQAAERAVALRAVAAGDAHHADFDQGEADERARRCR